MIHVDLENRSGIDVAAEDARAFATEILHDEGVADGELGLWFVSAAEMRALKQEHLGIDEITDVLSFPIDGTDELPPGLPRALGDVFICPRVVGDAWRAPLTHGLLHLLGYSHGPSMDRRERELLR